MVTSYATVALSLVTVEIAAPALVERDGLVADVEADEVLPRRLEVDAGGADRLVTHRAEGLGHRGLARVEAVVRGAARRGTDASPNGIAA